jgi:transposase
MRSIHRSAGDRSRRSVCRALPLQAFYSIRSERQLVEQIKFVLLFRWFVGLGVDDPERDAATFTKNRGRPLAA